MDTIHEEHPTGPKDCRVIELEYEDGGKVLEAQCAMPLGTTNGKVTTYCWGRLGKVKFDVPGDGITRENALENCHGLIDEHLRKLASQTVVKSEVAWNG